MKKVILASVLSLIVGIGIGYAMKPPKIEHLYGPSFCETQELTPPKRAKSKCNDDAGIEAFITCLERDLFEKRHLEGK